MASLSGWISNVGDLARSPESSAFVYTDLNVSGFSNISRSLIFA